MILAPAPGPCIFRSTLGSGWQSANENLAAPLAAISSLAQGSLFQVTLNFLLSIVWLITDRKEGWARNSYYLIPFKISNKPEQRLSPPNLSFSVFLLQSSLLGNCGEAAAGAPMLCESPETPKL